MRTLRFFASLFCLAFICSIFSPTAQADEWDKKTIVNFSGPVDVSGHRLEAGTYVFKLLDSPSNRNIVQIFNQDENHLYATILAIPDYRVTPTDKTEIKFSENAGDVSTVARDLPAEGIPIKEWFYPGDNFGQEFLVKPAPVMAAVNEAPEAAPTAEATPPAPEEKAPETAEAQPAPAAEAESAPAPEPQSTTAEQPAPVEPSTTPKEMPQTSSTMPLIGLVGLVSLGMGLTLRQVAKRMA